MQTYIFNFKELLHALCSLLQHFSLNITLVGFSIFRHAAELHVNCCMIFYCLTLLQSIHLLSFRWAFGLIKVSAIMSSDVRDTL